MTGSREWHYIQYITTHGIHDMIEIDYYTVRQHKNIKRISGYLFSNKLDQRKWKQNIRFIPSPHIWIWCVSNVVKQMCNQAFWWNKWWQDLLAALVAMGIKGRGQMRVHLSSGSNCPYSVWNQFGLQLIITIYNDDTDNLYYLCKDTGILFVMDGLFSLHHQVIMIYSSTL